MATKKPAKMKARKTTVRAKAAKKNASRATKMATRRALRFDNPAEGSSDYEGPL